MRLYRYEDRFCTDSETLRIARVSRATNTFLTGLINPNEIATRYVTSMHFRRPFPSRFPFTLRSVLSVFFLYFSLALSFPLFSFVARRGTRNDENISDSRGVARHGLRARPITLRRREYLSCDNMIPSAT